MVEPAQEPPACHFELNIKNAFPCRLRARAVSHPEEDAGDDLDAKCEGERATPDVTPARAAGDVFVKHLVRKLAVARATVEPVEHGFHAVGNHEQQEKIKPLVKLVFLQPF